MRNNQRRFKQTPSAAGAVESVASTMDFLSPTEFVELPSRGLFYPEDHPLHQQETVEIRFMTAKDEDILSSTALLKKGLAIDRLLTNLLVLDMDPRSLLLGDRNAVLIAARKSGYGSEYKFSIKCDSCAANNDIVYDLSEGEITGNCFDEKFLRKNNITHNAGTGTLDLVLPTSGVEVGVAFVDGHGEKQLLAEHGTENSVVTSVLASFIVKVNDDEDFNYVTNFIDSMPAKDSKFIRTLYPKLVPNIVLNHEFTCAACWSKNDVEVPLRAAFFWPE